MTATTRLDLAHAAWAAVDWVDLQDCRELVDQTLGEIAQALVEDRAVKISRFGTFEPHHAPPRIGRNPKRPDELHEIPAHRRVAFRPAEELKAAVDGRLMDVRKHR